MEDFGDGDGDEPVKAFVVMALHSYRSGTAQIHLNRCKVVLKEQTHKTHVYELANSVTVVLSLKFHFPRSLNTT